jgi:hypothetical protein
MDGTRITDPSTPTTSGILKFGKRTFRKIEL